MIVTPFGDLRYGDQVALDRWVDSHARRHRVLTQAAQVPGQNLFGHVDGDWFHRHWAATVTLAQYQGIDLASFGSQLALGWRDEREMLQWHEMHNRIHLKQDRQLKLV